MRFRRRPTTVEAEQFTGEGPDPTGVHRTADGAAYVVTAHEQLVFLEPSDWVIAEPDGRGHYPIRADIMAATYDPEPA